MGTEVQAGARAAAATAATAAATAAAANAAAANAAAANAATATATTTTTTRGKSRDSFGRNKEKWWMVLFNARASHTWWR